MNQANRVVAYIGGDIDRIDTVRDALAERGFTMQSFASTDVSQLVEQKAQIAVVLVEIHTEQYDHHKILTDLLAHLDVEQTPIVAVVENSIEVAESIKCSNFVDFLVTNDDTASNVQKILSLIHSKNSKLGLADIDLTSPQVTLTHTGVRVFIVEDDPLLKNLLSIRFDRASFPYEFNTNGVGVVHSAKRFRPDIIILDLMLPGVSGFSLLESIKNDPELSAIPVIIFSNQDSYDDKRRARELKASAFYVKAMTDLSELVAKIEQLATTPAK